MEDRTKKKHIEKVTWYKGWDQAQRAALTTQAQKNQAEQSTGNKPRRTTGTNRQKRLQASTKGNKVMEVVSALFVDRTQDGALLKKMREAEGRLSTLKEGK